MTSASGAPHGASRRSRSLPLAGIALLALAAAACGDDELVRVREKYELVGGQPSIDPSLPTIDRAGEAARPTDFGSNSPVQVDVFEQTQVAAVDILWVIDNSGSMELKQNKVKQNFQAFVAKLVENNTALDYHIGVITTDTVNPQEAGRLQNKAGLAKPWIGRDTCQPPACDPVQKFRENSSVGIQGSGDEKGLLAAMMALSPPLSTTGHNAGFLRPHAALFIIVLADEEDSSCAPLRFEFGGGCTAPLTYGTSDYYARFFEGLKGFALRDYVTLGAIVSTTETVLQSNPVVKGCRSVDNNQDVGVFAPRYIDVARRTGGLATSICDANYLPALTNLGFLATGAKSTFVLSRAPFADQVKVHVRKPGDAQPTTQVRGTHYVYEPCLAGGGGVLNAVRFLPDALPPAGSTIEVEYPVNVNGVSCQ